MSTTREALAHRVSRAIAAAGLSQAEVARRIRLDPSALSRALSGQRNLKSLELALIAKELSVSTESLLSEAEPPSVALAARAQPGAAPALTSALRLAGDFLDLDELLVHYGYGSSESGGVRVSGASTPHAQGEDLARGVREEMGIGDDDLPYELWELALALEQTLGIDVCFEPLSVGLDGLSVARGGLRLAIVGSAVAATRQRFTLAHELCHLVVGDSQELLVDENLFGRKTDDERRANAFAAAFLMPAHALREQVQRGYVSEDLIARLLGRYGVSLDALAFRLHNLDLINAATRERVRAMSSNRIALRSGRAADLQARNDQRAPGNLLVRTIEAYGGAAISIRPLASLLRVDPSQLLDELEPVKRAPFVGDVDTSTDDVEPIL
jgi:Zn-dependent peptidase ImmA (M78 family)